MTACSTTDRQGTVVNAYGDLPMYSVLLRREGQPDWPVHRADAEQECRRVLNTVIDSLEPDQELLLVRSDDGGFTVTVLATYTKPAGPQP